MQKAKKEKNYAKILVGYEDMVYYSAKRETKLSYADSSISYALKSKNNEIISEAYLSKGIIYYFFYRQYQPALDEYLRAYEYAKDIKNQYLKHRITYHLGVVKSYLGYDEEALQLFNNCVAYFEPLTHANIHPNLIFNNQKGYFNTQHQQIECYRVIGNFKKSDSLIQIGLAQLPRFKEFALEKSYFLKCSGIAYYRKGNYAAAIQNLNNALPGLTKIDDFIWTSISYFYIGKSYSALHNSQLAIPYFIKVDSIFQKQEFLFPNSRENYELLIDYYHRAKKDTQELYYTQQLLKVDNVLNKDFKYLSSKIHKEYDTKALMEKQEQLEGKNHTGHVFLMIAIILLLASAMIIFYRFRQGKVIQQKYEELEKQIIIQAQHSITTTTVIKENKTKVPGGIVEVILKKLEKFEQNNDFRKRGITLADLAKKFETNTAYLSQVINEYKGNNFSTYLNRLRIYYITQELYHHPVYLDFTTEGLAAHCGISSRQHFSELFIEINGMRPADFIKRRRVELDRIAV